MEREFKVTKHIHYASVQCGTKPRSRLFAIDELKNLLIFSKYKREVERRIALPSPVTYKNVLSARLKGNLRSFYDLPLFDLVQNTTYT